MPERRSTQAGGGGGVASWGRYEPSRSARPALFDQYVKRAIDLALATLVLVVCLPLLLVIAALITFDSAGPALFRQERVGARPPTRSDPSWRTRAFSILKFRSMRVDADPELHRAHIEALAAGAALASEKGVTKLVDDPRITRVGRVLRRTSLDELPQLINVLRGEMSLVGPRPVPPYEVETYLPWHHERLAALPGITGLWQIRGRGRVGVDDSIRMDIEYVRTRSTWLDLKILCLTVPAVLSRKGAH